VNRRFVVSIGFSLGLCWAVAGHSAQEDANLEAADGGPPLMRGMTPEERLAIWETLTDEEKAIVRKRRRAAREQQRAEWQAMTPEQREARLAEVRARAEQLTPQQREAARKFREQREQQARKRNHPPATEETSETVPAGDPQC
jgi:uncharacterized protein with NAD-binding domain and iron-sulfur cluster